MEERLYDDRQIEMKAAYEAKCRRCGVCCGSAGDDPCARLRREADGTHICTDYDHRLGVQKTVKGNEFHCVEIRDVIKEGVWHEGCGYN